MSSFVRRFVVNPALRFLFGVLQLLGFLLRWAAITACIVTAAQYGLGRIDALLFVMFLGMGYFAAVFTYPRERVSVGLYRGRGLVARIMRGK